MITIAAILLFGLFKSTATGSKRILVDTLRLLREYSSSYGSSGYGSSSSGHTMSSDPRAIDNSLRWIADEQRIHETTDFGENRRSVEESIADQKQRVKLVKDYKSDVDKLKRNKDGGKVEEKYKTLDAVAAARLECLEGVSKIAGLEDIINKLSTEFSIRSTQLVERGEPEAEETCDGLGAAAQNCILAVRANWSWISKLVHCTDIHLQNASDFHQFFHSAKEYERWMASDLQRAQEKVQQQDDLQPENADQKEASRLLLELREVLTTFLHWQGKIDDLFEKSKKIVPVQQRTKKLDYYRPVTALCNYKTKDINVREGEELTLTDNGNPEVWKVKSLAFTEAEVPSVILLIPGPDAEAVNLANKLRMQLLGIWTLNLKRIGKTLIFFMLLTVKDFDDNESKKLKAIPVTDKDEIRRILAFIESTLGTHWREYNGYKQLEGRNNNMRTILQAQGNNRDHDPKMTGDLKLKLETVEELLKKYKDFWDYWETYKCLVETSRNPEYLLIVDAWQQLKFLELEQLRKQWPHGLKLNFTDQDQTDFDEWMTRHGQREVTFEVDSTMGKMLFASPPQRTVTEVPPFYFRIA